MEPLSKLALSSSIRRTGGLIGCNSTRICSRIQVLRRPGFAAAASPPTNFTNSRTCSTFMQSVRGCSSELEESHQNTWTDLSFEDLSALINGGNIQLFDVREPKELKEYGAIPNAINIPLSELKSSLMMSDQQFVNRYNVAKPQAYHSNIVFYGLGPIKSTAAIELARKYGYKKSRHYKGGWEEWSSRTSQPLKK